MHSCSRRTTGLLLAVTRCLPSRITGLPQQDYGKGHEGTLSMPWWMSGLTGHLNANIYTEHLALVGAIARAIRQDIMEGAPLTSETTRRAFVAVREGFEEGQ